MPAVLDQQVVGAHYLDPHVWFHLAECCVVAHQPDTEPGARQVSQGGAGAGLSYKLVASNPDQPAVQQNQVNIRLCTELLYIQCPEGGRGDPLPQPAVRRALPAERGISAASRGGRAGRLLLRSGIHRQPRHLARGRAPAQRAQRAALIMC